jgi:translation initiation factor IF-1
MNKEAAKMLKNKRLALECESESGTDNHWCNKKLITIISNAFRRHP